MIGTRTISATRAFWAALIAVTFSSIGVEAIAADDQSPAEACVRNKVWEGYESGWALRTLTSMSLAKGEHRIFLLTLYGGHEYRMITCGDKATEQIALVLYDADGKPIDQNREGKEPALAYKVDLTDTYFVAVHADALAEGVEGKGNISLAITYR